MDEGLLLGDVLAGLDCQLLSDKICQNEVLWTKDELALTCMDASDVSAALFELMNAVVLS